MCGHGHPSLRKEPKRSSLGDGVGRKEEEDDCLHLGAVDLGGLWTAAGICPVASGCPGLGQRYRSGHSQHVGVAGIWDRAESRGEWKVKVLTLGTEAECPRWSLAKGS